MDRNRVTVRYARALIELASEQNILEKISTDSALMFTALDQYQGFSQYILNPGFSSSVKFAKVQSLFSKEFHELSMKFFELVFHNNREEYLKDLCRNIVVMARELNGILAANISTAKVLDEKLMQQLKAKFEQKLDAKLELTSEVNTELIGGFIFTIDGQQYDASVASKINSIKKQLQLK